MQAVKPKPVAPVTPVTPVKPVTPVTPVTPVAAVKVDDWSAWKKAVAAHTVTTTYTDACKDSDMKNVLMHVIQDKDVKFFQNFLKPVFVGLDAFFKNSATATATRGWTDFLGTKNVIPVTGGTAAVKGFAKVVAKVKSTSIKVGNSISDATKKAGVAISVNAKKAAAGIKKTAAAAGASIKVGINKAKSAITKGSAKVAASVPKVSVKVAVPKVSVKAGASIKRRLQAPVKPVAPVAPVAPATKATFAVSKDGVDVTAYKSTGMDTPTELAGDGQSDSSASAISKFAGLIALAIFMFFN